MTSGTGSSGLTQTAASATVDDLLRATGLGNAARRKSPSTIAVTQPITAAKAPTGAVPLDEPKTKAKAKAKGTKAKGTTISPSTLKGKLKVDAKDVASKGTGTKTCSGPKHAPVATKRKSSIPTAGTKPTISSDFPLYWKGCKISVSSEDKYRCWPFPDKSLYDKCFSYKAKSKKEAFAELMKFCDHPCLPKAKK